MQPDFWILMSSSHFYWVMLLHGDVELTFTNFLLTFPYITQAITALKKGAYLLKYGRRGKPKFCPFRLSPVSCLVRFQIYFMYHLHKDSIFSYCLYTYLCCKTEFKFFSRVHIWEFNHYLQKMIHYCFIREEETPYEGSERTFSLLSFSKKKNSVSSCAALIH